MNPNLSSRQFGSARPNPQPSYDFFANKPKSAPEAPMGQGRARAAEASWGGHKASGPGAAAVVYNRAG